MRPKRSSGRTYSGIFFATHSCTQFYYLGQLSDSLLTLQRTDSIWRSVVCLSCSMAAASASVLQTRWSQLAALIALIRALRRAWGSTNGPKQQQLLSCQAALMDLFEFVSFLCSLLTCLYLLLCDYCIGKLHTNSHKHIQDNSHSELSSLVRLSLLAFWALLASSSYLPSSSLLLLLLNYESKATATNGYNFCPLNLQYYIYMYWSSIILYIPNYWSRYMPILLKFM